jgi:hypothetical protein
MNAESPGDQTDVAPVAEYTSESRWYSGNRWLLKIVLAAILVGLLWKVKGFVYLDRVNFSLPLEDDFFPQFFRSQFTARYAYLIACFAAAIGVLCVRRYQLVACSLAVLLSAMTLNIHQASYNDVTFLCCSWSAVWCLWMAVNIDEAQFSLLPRAVWLSHVIISLIFLGGAIGKMTGGYWSGQILYEIYFQDSSYWIYSWVRDSFSREEILSIAMWHSRGVAIAELACGFLWLLPAKLASWVAIVMLSGIALTNNILLFSVVTPLIGLALVGLHSCKQCGKTDVDGLPVRR